MSSLRSDHRPAASGQGRMMFPRRQHVLRRGAPGALISAAVAAFLSIAALAATPATASAGLDALPTFMDSPTWASGLNTALAPPQPSQYPAWRAFIRAAVARYGVGGAFWKGGHYCADGVTPVPAAPATVWEVWNEPNVSVFWGGRTPSAPAYAQLLAVADQAIDTSVNPGAKVVLGGLTNDAAGFLKALYTAMPELTSHF